MSDGYGVAEELADLDEFLADDGETLFLWRGNGARVTCRAFVRGYQPQEIVGSITQQDLKVILSPTQINAAGWPNLAPTTPAGDPRIPLKGDRMLTSRGPLTVQAAVGIYAMDTLVRIEAQARGNG